MSAVAFALVMASALTHATWNLFAKRATTGGSAFVWLTCVCTSVVYLPVVVFVLLRWPHRALEPRDGAVIVASGLLHFGYFICLQRGYRFGDLSFVYPIARATGPMVATAIAVAIFHEHLGVAGAIGAGLIIGGTLLMSLQPEGAGANATSLRYGLVTGCFIAAYTLCDKFAVATLALEPIVYDYLRNLVQVVVIAPLAWSRRADVVRALRDDRTPIAVVAVLSPFAYVLILFALATSPVSVVAPLREVGVVFGALLGAHVLRERDPLRRSAAAVLIFIGIAVLFRR